MSESDVPAPASIEPQEPEPEPQPEVSAAREEPAVPIDAVNGCEGGEPEEPPPAASEPAQECETSQDSLETRGDTSSIDDGAKSDAPAAESTESELENFDAKIDEKKAAPKRRKLSGGADSGAEGATGEELKRGVQGISGDFIMPRKPNKDVFCWRCHHDSVQVACETCPRAYHLRCLKQTIVDAEHWPCPECVSILKAENTQTRSKAMKGMSLEHLCSLLKFAVKRMIQCNGSEPFIHPVDEAQFPEYRSYIVQPMTLTMLEKNIKDNAYGSTQAFEADAKWILHNSIIFNSYQSKLTSAAKTIVKICKQEMAEVENCSSCYLNANTKKHTWFVEVCPKPHLLVWAKLKGFPYWPAKVMSINSSGMADVRFFGAHDKAWVSVRECYLYSVKDPNSGKQKRNDIIECVKELELYVDNLREIYGRVNFAPFKTPLEADSQLKQLQVFLPNYRNDGKEVALRKMKERNEKSLSRSIEETTEEEDSEESSEEDEDEEEEEEDERGKKKGDEKTNGNKQKEGMMRVDYRDKSIDQPKLVARPMKAIMVRKRYLSDSPQENSIKLARRDTNKADTPRLSVDNHIKACVTPEKMNSLEKEEDQSLTKTSPHAKLRISDELIKKLGDLDETDTEKEKPIETVEGENEVEKNEEEDGMILVEKLEESANKDEEKEDLTVDKKEDERKDDQIDKVETDKKEDDQVDRVESEKNKSESKIEERTEEKRDETLEDSEKSLDKSVIEDEKSKNEKEKVTVAKKGESEMRKANHVSSVKELVTKSTEKSKEKERTTRKRRHEDPKPEKSKPKEPAKDSSVFPPNKMVKLVPIENILQRKNVPEPSPKKPDQLIVLKEIRVVKDGKEVRTKTKKPDPGAPTTPVAIKSEVESDEDNSDVQYMEAKRQYLSALNISEKQKVPSKPKAHEIRTRSKTEEKKSKKEETPKAGEEATKEAAKSAEPAKEIYIKSLAKMQTPKHKARKSFPTPNYGKKTIVARKIVPKTPLQREDELTLVNSTTLQPTANVMILPKLHYTKPMTRDISSPPVLTMLPRPSLEQNALSAAAKKALDGSQNYIPQNEEEERMRAQSSGGALLLNNLLTAAAAAPPPVIDVDNTQPSNPLDAELNVLKEMLPEGLRKGVGELLCQPPPKLRPKPVGILNSAVEAGVPSTAGPVASTVNSMAHKLGDYFRSLLVETISDIGKTGNAEATISSLKYEIEELNHKHTIELAEIRRNVSIVLKDIQKSVVEERERIINETKANCEMEMMKKVEEAKSKQWCANCSKEAQFYCCWNTSYCDYPCQQKHWPKHMSKCTQTSSPQTQTTTSPVRTAPGQQLLLTQTTAPKFGTLCPKPQKVYLKRTNIPFKPTPGGHITLVESTPGNFELLGSGPIAVNGKILASTSVLEKIKSGSSVVTVTAPSSTTNTQLTSASQKVNAVPRSAVSSAADSEH